MSKSLADPSSEVRSFSASSSRSTPSENLENDLERLLETGKTHRMRDKSHLEEEPRHSKTVGYEKHRFKKKCVLQIEPKRSHLIDVFAFEFDAIEKSQDEEDFRTAGLRCASCLFAFCDR